MNASGQRATLQKLPTPRKPSISHGFVVDSMFASWSVAHANHSYCSASEVGNGPRSHYPGTCLLGEAHGQITNTSKFILDSYSHTVKHLGRPDSLSDRSLRKQGRLSRSPADSVQLTVGSVSQNGRATRSPADPAQIATGSVRRVVASIVIRAASRCRPPTALKAIGFARRVFTSPLISALCSLPAAHSQSNDSAALNGACDDVSSSALAEKRDWFKTRLSLSCPSCTKMTQFKSQSDNDLRKGLQTTAFSLVCHGVSCNVIVRHGSSRCFDDFVRSFRFRFAHFNRRAGGRVTLGNHRCFDRADIACQPRAFVPLGEIANGFVRNQGLRADPRQKRCLIAWLQRSMPAATSGSLSAKRLTSPSIDRINDSLA